MKLSIGLPSQLRLSVFGSDALWLIWVLDRRLPPPSTLTVRAHWQLRETQFFHARTKHIEVHYHYVRERLSAGDISLVYVPTQDPDTTVRETYQWMRSHYLLSLLFIAVVEATANLVLYGAVLREVLDWKHRPEIIVPVFAGIIGLVSGLAGEVHLMIPTMMTVVIEGWVYEYSRSVIPVIIGDVFFWAVYLAIMGFTFPWWCFLIAAAIIIPGAYLTIKTMDPYKPID